MSSVASEWARSANKQSALSRRRIVSSSPSWLIPVRSFVSWPQNDTAASNDRQRQRASERRGEQAFEQAGEWNPRWSARSVALPSLPLSPSSVSPLILARSLIHMSNITHATAAAETVIMGDYSAAAAGAAAGPSLFACSH